MKPVKQTILHNPEAGQYGNCAQAAFASIMGCSLERVPHFSDGLSVEDGGVFMDRVNDWLKPMGYGMICLAVYPEFLPDWSDHVGRACDYHLITGMSPRGNMHLVVGKAGKVVHDPHPSNDGLLPPTDDQPWSFDLIIRR